MTLDPVAKAILDLLAESGAPPLSEQTPSEARAAYEATRSLNPNEGAEVASIVDLELASVPCRVVTPLEVDRTGALVFLHGGGWVLGTMELYTPVVRDLAAAARCPVIAVDYRLAPEHRFPSAVEDCLAVLDALQAGALPAIDGRHLVVAGDSAGGNLAAICAFERPQLAASALIYPVTDAERALPSYTSMGEGYFLTADAMDWFYDHYAPGVDPRNPLLSPLHASDEQLAGVPRTLVLVADYDPLADEGLAYAARLAGLGVPVEVTRYEHQMHGFFTMSPFIADAARAISQVAGLTSEALPPR